MDQITQIYQNRVRQIFGAVKMLVAVMALAGLASCSSNDLGGMFQGGSGGNFNNNAGIAQPAKVALLLPLSAPGRTASIAAAMKKAAELALFEAGKSNVTLITKDTAGNPRTAAAMAQSAISEGAEIILGPLLGTEVAAVTPVARQNNVPVIAFSSVAKVARPGVYLMSFLPQEEVSNLLRYTSRTGVRTIVAMIPQSQYGAVIERALKRSAARLGTKISAVERYNRNGSNLKSVANRVARAVNSPTNPAQAVFIPEGGQTLRSIGTALTQAGFSNRSTKVLGTGLWDSPVTNGTPLAFGGLYAGVSPQKVASFSQRYSSSYQAKPPRIASLSYDAMSLTLAFAKAPIGTRFKAAQITNVEGFNGVNGLFRFRPDGRIERGLSILQVSSTGTRVAAPAPAKFQFGF